MSNNVEIIVTGSDRSAPAFISATAHVREYRREAENAGAAASAAIDDISDSADLAVVFLQQIQQEFTALLSAAESSGGGPAEALSETAEAAGDAERAAEDMASAVTDALNEVATDAVAATEATDQLGDAVADVNSPAELAATAAALDEVGDQARQAADAVEDIGREGLWARIRAAISRLIPDMDEVRNHARGIGSSLEEGILSLTDNLPDGIAGAIRSAGPAGAAAAAGVGASVGAVLVSAIAGVLVGGAGVVGIAAGIAAAAKDPKVQEAASGFKDVFSREFADIGAIFSDPVIDSIKIIKDAFTRIDFSDMLAPLADALVPLTSGLSGMLENMAPGLRHIFEAGGELLSGISNNLEDLGGDIGEFLDRLATIGPAGQSALELLIAVLEPLIDVMGLAIEGVGELWMGVVNLADAIGLINSDAASDELKHLLIPLDENAVSFQNMADAAKQAAEAQEAARVAAEELQSSLRGIYDGAIAMQEAMWDLEESVSANGTSLDYSTKKGMENVKVIEAMVDAANQQADAARESSIASGDSANAEAKATATRNAAIAKILEQASALGLDRAQVQSLINTLQGLPTGDKYLNYTVRTTYQVQYDQAQQRAYGSGYAGAAQAAGMSSGGRVSGSGGDTADTELRRLSVEEHVMTAAEVRAAGGHENVYALRRNLLSGKATVSNPVGVSAGGGTPSGGGQTFVINSYSLDPSTAGDIIVRALESWTQSNGTLPSGWVAA